MAIRIAVGDARQKLRLMRSESINCAISSPPYWLKRNYNAGPDELGREPTIQAYIDNLLGVIDEVYRILLPHGSMWLNVGDSYITQAGTSRGQRYTEPGRIKNVNNGEMLIKGNELPHKSLCLIPYRLAIAMQDRGWIVRNVIIWHKPACMPESVQDRFTVDYEPLLFCTKNPQYYFRQQLQPYSDATLKRCKKYIENGEAFDPARHKVDPSCPTQAPTKLLERLAKNLAVPGRSCHTMHRDRANGNGQDVFSAAGANMRSVWRISTAGYRGAHFAVFPEKLVEICINAGCPVGGTVLDPFVGAGTTAIVAERMGRDFYGIELNPEYARQATERILEARSRRTNEADGARAGSSPNGVSVVEPTDDGGLTFGEELDRTCFRGDGSRGADAAAAYVEQVGSLPYAARVLAMMGIRSGDKEMLQNALKEMILAAQIILSRAEINEIVAPAPYSDNKPKKRRNANRLDNCHTDCERTPREIAALGHKVMLIDLDPAFCEAANTVVHADKSFSPAERLPRIDWSHEEFVENERS
ncbi:MAG: site-specific DNA-methyltransferase [Thermoguttaceae bacterium]